MDRANLNVSRFLTFAAVAAAGFLCGCQPDDTTTTYDPRIDGINPPQVATAEPGILDDQKNRPHVTPAVLTPAKPATPAATSTPAAGGGGSATPPPPPEGALAAAPPGAPPPSPVEATPPASAPAAKAGLNTAEGAIRELMTAMLLQDQARINQCTTTTDGREILSQGEKPPADVIAHADAMVAAIKLRQLKVGDTIKVKTADSPEGEDVQLDATVINANRQMFMPEGQGPVTPPFTAVKQGDQWKVDPALLIADRKSAPKPKPAPARPAAG